MFNVTVLRLKDIMKYIICIFVLILLIFSIANYFTNTKKDTKEVTTKIENVTNEISNNNLLSCLDATIPAVASINNNKEKSEKTLNKNQILKSILETQISSLNTIQNIDTKQDETTESNDEIEENTANVEVAKTNQETHVITNNPIAENYNTTAQNQSLKNHRSGSAQRQGAGPPVPTSATP